MKYASVIPAMKETEAGRPGSRPTLDKNAKPYPKRK
jgi:hypothetical protein